MSVTNSVLTVTIDDNKEKMLLEVENLLFEFEFQIKSVPYVLPMYFQIGVMLLKDIWDESSNLIFCNWKEMNIRLWCTTWCLRCVDVNLSILFIYSCHIFVLFCCDALLSIWGEKLRNWKIDKLGWILKNVGEKTYLELSNVYLFNIFNGYCW